MTVFYRNFEEGKDWPEFIPLFWEFWLQVNEEDLSDKKEYELMGKKTTMTRAEAMVFYYLALCHDIKIAEIPTQYNEWEMIGFMIYRTCFGHILEVPCLYVIDEFRDKFIGKEFVDSVGPQIDRVLFQTRKAKPPEQFLRSTEKHRQLIKSGENLLTWEMGWKHGRRSK